MTLFEINEDCIKGFSLRDSVAIVVEEHKKWNIHEITTSPEVEFKKHQPGDFSHINKSGTVWTRFQIKNNTKETKNYYFSMFTFIDSAWIYTFEGNRLINTQISGASIQTQQKAFPSSFNNIPFSIDPDKTKTFYLKMKYLTNFKLAESNGLLTILSARPILPLVQSNFKEFRRYFFYSGAFILFSLLSLFMFYIFREKIFLWFSLLVFSFACYFLSITHFIETVLNVRGAADSNLYIHLSLSGVVISLTQFFSAYIDLRKFYPKYFAFYHLYAIFTALFPHFFGYFGDLDVFTIGYYSNYVIFSWIIITILPVITLTKKGNKASKSLLVATGILVISGLLYILEVTNVIPSNPITESSFQISTVLFSGILFYHILQKINNIRNEKKHLEELDKLKSRFFTNISHEFRTPLTLVLGPLKDIINSEEKKQYSGKLKMAYKNAERLLHLINKILDLSKLETGKMELQISTHNFVSLLKGIALSFDSWAQKKNIKLNFISKSDEILMYFDSEKIEIIFFNLLSNALKFTQENGEISVLVSEKEKHIEILVRDNGVGIEPDRLENIFNRFFHIDHQETKEYQGTGIGLALVKELVHIHYGEIQVESELNKGTSFTIILRKGKEHFANIPMDDHQSNQQLSTLKKDTIEEKYEAKIPSSLIQKGNKNKTLVLIVEDHLEVRAYIKEHLEEQYQIVEAQNGLQGQEIAFKLMPDIIISDIMMPKLDGYGMSKALKNDERTSHIPIILLTAKSTQEEKIKGLKIGVDDYLVKPFDTKELKIRVANIIESREQLRKNYSNTSQSALKRVGTNPIDDIFLEKVINIIEKKLSSSELNVEYLASEIGMSKVHLNRKLNALSNLSANRFIRNYRLEKAHELIHQKVGNVSQIAMDTGFGSTAYFVKCFKEKYNITPGALLSQEY
ncbi:MAG: response regulator [Flavobacteriales bacterium]|jgi:signal transduction histidine kinase/DNA-binding response OmpR family regulator|nr:response regulator [Flavobacteriales bacterium]